MRRLDVTKKKYEEKHLAPKYIQNDRSKIVLTGSHQFVAEFVVVERDKH